MKMVIIKKGVVDCTSDSRTYDMQTLREGIEAAIKIFDKEVLELGEARFNIKSDSKLIEYQRDKEIKTIDKEIKIIDKEIKIIDKKTCMKLLNHFKNNPDELSEEESPIIDIRVKMWKFFNEGNNCSDYIELFPDRLEVSCQDYYDEDQRLEFHKNIEKLLDEEYAVAIDENLISLHINVTEKCKVNCKTCYVNRGLQRELEKEDWINLPKAEQYAIGGGEPAEYPYISELVDFIKNERNGYVAITTNGQKIIEFAQHLPDKIAVSIDGLTQKEHNMTHNTNLKIAKFTAEIYKTKGIDVCINHILHKENINNVEKFSKKWTEKGYEVNLILFIGKDGKDNKDNLRLTFEQIIRFKEYFDSVDDNRIMIDSCMGGLLNMLDSLSKNYYCQQGLYSKYYRFGAINPCSHSAIPYPNCSTIEDYMKYFFKTLRPIVFIYDNDGTSGAHEWAFKAGFRGKIKHKIDKPLMTDKIYIMTYDEAQTIAESHYQVYFKNKMPYWLSRCIRPLQRQR